jgi:hypothetical protein
MAGETRHRHRREGLGRQTTSARTIEPHLEKVLREKTPPAAVLVAALRTARALDHRRLWKGVQDLAGQVDDDVVVAALENLGAWRELRAHHVVCELWFRCPSERKWVAGWRITSNQRNAVRVLCLQAFGSLDSRRPRPASPAPPGTPPARSPVASSRPSRTSSAGCIVASNHTCKSGGALEARFGLGSRRVADLRVSLPDRRSILFRALRADRFLDLDLSREKATDLTSDARRRRLAGASRAC